MLNDTMLRTDAPATETAPLHLLQIIPDMPRLIGWALEQRLLSRGGDDDLGYALHAVLKAVFGDMAPKPFVLIQYRRRPATLLAYSSHSAGALHDYAATFAGPQVLATLGIEKMVGKVMPRCFAAGRRLGFEVRICPTVRVNREKNPFGARERDAFLSAIAGAELGEGPSREEVYRDWMHTRLAIAGAKLEHMTIDSLRRTTTMRRNGARALRSVDYPDITVCGTLTVTDPTAFAALLARGVGRHRAFGFGMLLLRPAESS